MCVHELDPTFESGIVHDYHREQNAYMTLYVVWIEATTYHAFISHVVLLIISRGMSATLINTRIGRATVYPGLKCFRDGALNQGFRHWERVDVLGTPDRYVNHDA